MSTCGSDEGGFLKKKYMYWTDIPKYWLLVSPPPMSTYGFKPPFLFIDESPSTPLP